jgi:hypothetical protein
MSVGAITTTYARPRASVAAMVLAAVFASGVLAGLAAAPALQTASRGVTLGAVGLSSQAAAQARLSWLAGEHDAYAPAAISPAAEIQSWLAFRRSEEGYTTERVVPTSTATWIEFRRSEEGYAP